MSGERSARVDSLIFSDLDQVGQSINSMADAIQRHENAAEESMRALEHQYALVERAKKKSPRNEDRVVGCFRILQA